MINVDKLISAAKENRVIILPVALHDTLYIASPQSVDTVTVTDFDFDFTDEVHIDIIAKYTATDNTVFIADSDFGYSVFCDIESAVKAYEIFKSGADESA